MYGERGRIGLVTLASDTSVLPEYGRLMPPGVVVYPAPIELPRGEVSPQALDAMLANDDLERAAALLRWAGVGAVVFACTTGSLVHGVGWDRRLVERLEGAAGVPATTTATAVLDALRVMGARTVAVATPYIDDLNAIERRFLEDSGFEVTAVAGLGCATDAEIGRLWPADAETMLAEVDSPAADALFVSCTNWHCVEAVPRLEAERGKPVVTSNLAGAWAALRLLGIADAASRSGFLLDMGLAAGSGART